MLIPNKTINILSKISANSFGIYLFHSPLIYITFRYLPNINPILMFIINFICLGIVVYYLTIFLRKLKLGIIIGEKIRKDR